MAAARELVDYTVVPTPWDPILVAATGRGICCCDFLAGRSPAQVLAAAGFRGREIASLADQPLLAAAASALERYCHGEAETFDLRLDLHGTEFQRRVWEELRRIPFGEVTTYGDIAARMGRPQAARAVGQGCGRNPVILMVPCHRVVAANGKLGGFTGGIHFKQALLRHEGHTGF